MKTSDMLLGAGLLGAGYYFFVHKPQQAVSAAYAGGQGAVDKIIETVTAPFTPAPDPHVTVVPSTPLEVKKQEAQQAAIRASGGLGVTQVQMAQAGIPRADQVRYIPIANQRGIPPQVSVTATVGAQQTQPVSYQVGGQPTSGTYWVNPQTQGAIAPYVAGITPRSVFKLREQDIFPAIRGF